MTPGEVLGVGVAVAGAVLAWLVRIEHRITKLETLLSVVVDRVGAGPARRWSDGQPGPGQ